MQDFLYVYGIRLRLWYNEESKGKERRTSATKGRLLGCCFPSAKRVKVSCGMRFSSQGTRNA